MGLKSGELLDGRFEIIDLIGKGGMGEVYRARDKSSGARLVAIKNINIEFLTNIAFKERFKREVLNAMGLHHPNIVEGIEYLQGKGMEAFVMEYVDGGDLAWLMRQQPGLEVIVKVLRGILQGLSAIHDAGMVHRDLKPENILLDRNFTPKITDFGASRFLSAASITQEGICIGTPMYVAPEYIETGESDERGDVFAWGVLAYEMLAGRAPYSGKSKAEIIAARFAEVPALHEVNKKVPAALALIVEKAMRVRIVERYQSVREVLADLDKSL